MADEPRKQSLIAELATARSQLAAHTLGVRRGASISERLKRGVRDHLAVWFGSAMVVGLLLSRLVRTGPKVAVKGARKAQVEKAGKAAFGLTLLKFGLDFAKPAMLSWLKDRVLGGFSKHRKPRG